MCETGCKPIRILNGYLNFTDCISWILLAYIWEADFLTIKCIINSYGVPGKVT